jgi:acetylglutamate kinase
VLKRRVVKIGGGYLEDERWLVGFGRAMREYGPAVIVHGGGHAITARQREAGIPVVRTNGIRTTTPELASLVREVLCGTVRTRIVGALRSAGLDPVGVAGTDGFLGVDLVDEPALGMVGRVVTVDVAELTVLLRRGKTPVLAPVSLDGRGRLVNVNADEAAAAVAAHLGAEELVLVTDVEGVLAKGHPLPHVTDADVDALLESGVVADRMAAKLDAVRRARVPARIGDLDMLRGAQAGTRFIPGSRPVAA